MATSPRQLRYFKCSQCGAIVSSIYDLGGNSHEVVPSAACSGVTSLYEIDPPMPTLVWQNESPQHEGQKLAQTLSVFPNGPGWPVGDVFGKPEATVRFWEFDVDGERGLLLRPRVDIRNVSNVDLEQARAYARAILAACDTAEEKAAAMRRPEQRL